MGDFAMRTIRFALAFALVGSLAACNSLLDTEPGRPAAGRPRHHRCPRRAVPRWRAPTTRLQS